MAGPSVGGGARLGAPWEASGLNAAWRTLIPGASVEARTRIVAHMSEQRKLGGVMVTASGFRSL